MISQLKVERLIGSTTTEIEIAAKAFSSGRDRAMRRYLQGTSPDRVSEDFNPHGVGKGNTFALPTPPECSIAL